MISVSKATAFVAQKDCVTNVSLEISQGLQICWFSEYLQKVASLCNYRETEAEISQSKWKKLCSYVLEQLWTQPLLHVFLNIWN